MIEQLVDLLRGRVDDLGWEDVADVIWLAAYLPAPKVPDQLSSPGGTDTDVKPPLPRGAGESPLPEPYQASRGTRSGAPTDDRVFSAGAAAEPLPEGRATG